MQHALKLAKRALDCDEVPVGALLIFQDRIVAQAYNSCEKNHNSLYHAEMLVIYRGIQYLKTPYLNNCTLYVTLEPCPMCAAAIVQARVGKIVFGAYNPKSGGIEHGSRIFEHASFCPEVIGGVLENQCSELLKSFFYNKRSRQNANKTID